MSTIRILALVTLAAVLPAQEKNLPASKPQARDTKTSKTWEKVATLGVDTRAPTKEECVRYALELNRRYKGQVIDRLRKASAGAKAGLVRGDIIVAMDRVEIFSADDIRDLLMVRKPGQKVTLQVIRGKDNKKETVRLKLGEKKVLKRRLPRLTWNYAGLPYLEDALARARRESKRVLVGLSGADT